MKAGERNATSYFEKATILTTGHKDKKLKSMDGLPLATSLISDSTGRAGGGVSLEVVCCGEFVEIRTNQNIVGVAHLYRKHCTSYT